MTNETTKTITADITHMDTTDPRLVLMFANGEELCIKASMLTVPMAQQAMMHGLKQKLVDAAAISRNPDTGRSATVDDKYNAVKEVYDRLLSGQWNKTRGEGGTGSGGLLYRALCILYADKTPEAIRAFLAGKDAKQQAALRNNAKVAAIIATLKADNSDDIDTDEMLADLI